MPELALVYLLSLHTNDKYTSTWVFYNASLRVSSFLFVICLNVEINLCFNDLRQYRVFSLFVDGDKQCKSKSRSLYLPLVQSTAYFVNSAQDELMEIFKKWSLKYDVSTLNIDFDISRCCCSVLYLRLGIIQIQINFCTLHVMWDLYFHQQK